MDIIIICSPFAFSSYHPGFPSSPFNQVDCGNGEENNPEEDKFFNWDGWHKDRSAKCAYLLEWGSQRDRYNESEFSRKEKEELCQAGQDGWGNPRSWR